MPHRMRVIFCLFHVSFFFFGDVEPCFYDTVKGNEHRERAFSS